MSCPPFGSHGLLLVAVLDVVLVVGREGSPLGCLRCVHGWFPDTGVVRCLSGQMSEGRSCEYG